MANYLDTARSSIPEVDIEGIDGIFAVLDNLPKKITRQLLFNAHKKILRENVQGDLKGALSTFSRASRTAVSIRKAKGTESGAYIGITTNAFWLRFVNYGTEQRRTKAKKITRIKTKRYYSVGRLGRAAAANRGQVVGDLRISSLLERRANKVLEEVQVTYGKHFEDAINDQLKRFKKKGLL